MHDELGLQRFAWLTGHVGIFPADFQSERLPHRIVKEGREVHPHPVQRVGLLNVKTHHEFTALALQGIRLFGRAVVVGVVVPESLNVIKLSLSGTPIWLVRLATPLRFPKGSHGTRQRNRSTRG